MVQAVGMDPVVAVDALQVMLVVRTDGDNMDNFSDNQTKC